MDNDFERDGRDSLEQFATYEDYLDSLVTEDDRFYLDDDDLARELVAVGGRKGEVLSKEEFQARKEASGQQKLARNQMTTKSMAAAGANFINQPFLSQLIAREELVRSGKMSSIIFIRDHNKEGHEISGYIDLAHRLKTDDFDQYFSGKARLLPRPSDLSFYNWRTHFASSNESPDFQVLPDHESCGLQFKNKRDRKIIVVDPDAARDGETVSRHEVETEEYMQVVFFDHITRKRS